MKAQQTFVERFLDWNKVHERLKNYNSIRKYYGEDIFHSCSDKPPYYCHYIAWRLGTWHDDHLFEIFDSLLGVAAELPNWEREFSSFKASCDFAEYWSLLWQLQVGYFFATKENSVSWNPDGPDLEVNTKEGIFFVECYSFRKSFGIEEFIREIFSHLDRRIRVVHRSYMPFQLPQNKDTEGFLNDLFSPYLDKAFIEKKRMEAKKSYPIPLPVPSGSKNFHVFLEGEDIDNYDPTVFVSFTGDPERYLSDAIDKAVGNKRDSNQLRGYRPNVLAINYLLSSDYQTARSRHQQLGIEMPSINYGTTLDAVLLAACGIDQELSHAVVSAGHQPHPIVAWLKRHGMISNG